MAGVSDGGGGLLGAFEALLVEARVLGVDQTGEPLDREVLLGLLGSG